jgi:copper(I)-binding protein
MKAFLLGLVCAAAAAGAHAQLTVQDPWVRATVPGQTVSGAFMQLTSAAEARLVEARSPVAARTEIHEMKMEGDVMKMRALPALPLPAGQAVSLKPGGYHVMLLDLHGRIQPGDTVPLTLVVEGKDGRRQTVEVKAVARALGAAAPR